jgi:thioredoxin-dependent peroxiredoxin
MVDPPKATKGRRMSKKTRKKPIKKPLKTTSGKATRAQSKTKTPAAKTRQAKAGKSGKTANKKPANVTPRTSQKAPPKKLKTSRSGESPVRAGAGSKATAAKPEAGSPPARKAPGGKAGTPAMGISALSEGAKAPAFRLPRDGGDIVSLSDYSGRKLVLFFYPRANTPGCTKEAIDFTRLSGAFAEAQTAVLGVSADPLTAQQAFRDKHELSVPLVSDEKHEMLDAYGVWGEKSMYGKTFHGIFRATVLIGADGRIIRIWRNVKVDGHADEVLAAVRAL